MKKIAASLLILVTTVTLAVTPVTPPEPTTAPAMSPTPQPTSCYIGVSQQTSDEDKACSVHQAPACSKNHRSCKWLGPDRRCKGLIASFCLELAPRVCKEGIELVVNLPKKMAKDTHKFQCQEKTPIKLKKL